MFTKLINSIFNSFNLQPLVEDEKKEEIDLFTQRENEFLQNRVELFSSPEEIREENNLDISMKQEFVYVNYFCCFYYILINTNKGNFYYRFNRHIFVTTFNDIKQSQTLKEICDKITYYNKSYEHFEHRLY